MPKLYKVYSVRGDQDVRCFGRGPFEFSNNISGPWLSELKLHSVIKLVSGSHRYATHDGQLWKYMREDVGNVYGQTHYRWVRKHLLGQKVRFSTNRNGPWTEGFLTSVGDAK